MKYILALVAFAALPAHAQTQCVGRADGLAMLSERYGESRIGAGLATNGGLIEVFTNPESRSWTLTVSGPDGQICLVASGEAWEQYQLPPQGTPG